MRTFLLAFNCLPCIAHGKRLQTSASQLQSSQAVPKEMIAEVNLTAAFNPVGPAQRASLGKSNPAGVAMGISSRSVHREPSMGISDGSRLSEEILAVLEPDDSVTKILKARTASRMPGGSTSVDLSIVIPAFNEKERLPVMLNETLGYLKQRTEKSRSARASNSNWSKSEATCIPGFTYEIIVVDDGSTDGTSKLVWDNYSNEYVQVVRLKQNMGKGMAVRVGMLSAEGKRRLMADADGATKFSDLEKLDAALDLGADCAFGSRHYQGKGEKAKRAWYRNFLTNGLQFLVKLFITGFNDVIHDTQCGFKLFTCEAAEKLFPALHIKGWAFDLELVVLSRLRKLSVAEVAVDWTEIQGSKVGVVSTTASMLRDMVWIRLKYALGLW